MAKYLNIDEAAKKLGMERSELNRLREKGEIRAFADRGNWKFKEEDVDNLARTRQADSSPEVRLVSPKDVGDDTVELAFGEEALSEQETVVRRTLSDDGSDSDVQLIEPEAGSDSEVLSARDMSSDSDIRLAKDPKSDKLKKQQLGQSDSEVRLGTGDSDSDVKLADLPGADSSDSDVKLVNKPKSDIKKKLGGDSKAKLGSDSKAKLGGRDSNVLGSTDSDVSLVSDSKIKKGSKSGKGKDFALPDMNASETLSLSPLSDDDLPPDDRTINLAPAGGGFALDDDADPLAPDSGLPLTASKSGIALDQPNDSGIALDDGSALTLAGDSGISLDEPIDSGISLGDDSPMAQKAAAAAKGGAKSGVKKDDDFGATIPMMGSPLGDEDLVDSSMEVPLLAGDSSGEIKAEDDSSYELASDSDDATNVISLDDDEPAPKAKGKAAVVEEESSDEVEEFAEGEEEMEVSDEAEEIVGEDDELEEMDVFGAEDEDFEGEAETGESHAEIGGPMVSRIAAPVEQEWGAGVFVGVALSTLLMVLCGTVMFDLVRSMWHADLAQQNPVSSALLNMLSGLFT